MFRLYRKLFCKERVIYGMPYMLANPEYMYPAKEKYGRFENYYDNKYIRESLIYTRLLSHYADYLNQTTLLYLTQLFRKQQNTLKNTGYKFWTRTMLNHSTKEELCNRVFYVVIDYRKEPLWLPMDDEKEDHSILKPFACTINNGRSEPFLYYTIAGEKTIERMKSYSILKHGPEENVTFFKKIGSNFIKVYEYDVSETEDLFATSAPLFLYSAV